MVKWLQSIPVPFNHLNMSPFHPISLIVTFFGAGLSPKAPGTAGSLAALPVGYAIHQALGIEALAVAAALAFCIGWWASNRYLAARQTREDRQEIVIDEVAGVWAVIAAMPLMYLNPAPSTVLWMYGAAFVAFRFFDILKPWPVSLADRRIKGGLGVMLDDILAAVYALITLGALGHLASYMGWVHIAMEHAS